VTDAVKTVVKRLPGVRALRRLRVNKWRGGPIMGDLHHPAEQGESSDTVEVRGWALSTDGRDVVADVEAGGRTVTVQPKEPSPLLHDLFGDIRGAANAGFMARIAATDLGLAAGERVTVTATARRLGTPGAALRLGVRGLTYRPGLKQHARGDCGAEWDAPRNH
jgi:hypothetical protein